jgi:hypothetical protein
MFEKQVKRVCRLPLPWWYSGITELNPRDAAQSSAKIEQYFTAGGTVNGVW